MPTRHSVGGHSREQALPAIPGGGRCHPPRPGLGPQLLSSAHLAPGAQPGPPLPRSGLFSELISQAACTAPRREGRDCCLPRVCPRLSGVGAALKAGLCHFLSFRLPSPGLGAHSGPPRVHVVDRQPSGTWRDSGLVPCGREEEEEEAGIEAVSPPPSQHLGWIWFLSFFVNT